MGCNWHNLIAYDVLFSVTAMSFESQVYDAHRRGRLDATLVTFFLPRGEIRNIEGPMWDYKVGFCHPKAVIKDESLLACELLHDIAGFYNAFGGYLIIAFPPGEESRFAKFTIKDDFDKLSDRFLRTYIPLESYQTKSVLQGKTVNILLLRIGKREVGPPIAYKRNSVQRPDKSSVFKSDDIPLRYGSSTLIINQRHDLLVFAFGERKLDVGEIPSPLNEIDNNLPPRDPNLLEFIGREEYLVTLWNWLTDIRNPVKVLTALGGTGKTAIAYEFCEQLVKARTEAFAKVIWLTAKSQTYAAILQQYVSTTRTDFTDVNSFLDSFLRELGCLDTDFADFDQLEDKLDFAKDIIRDIPVFLVIDDLDSLDQDKQIELYSRIAQLFDQALSPKSPSRVLFTSRLETSAGVNRIIKIHGFTHDETVEYTKSLVRHLDGSETWGPKAIERVNEILDASKGSPIFIASILRLASFGDDLESVIENWRGRDGEEVRRFAFKREIDSLSYIDLRILYVLQLLAASTFEELMELVGEDRQSLQASLLRMSQFHLFAGNANPATGAQLSIPEPIRLMIQITEGKLHSDDATELKKRAARVNRATDGQSAVGRRVRAIILLWRRKRVADALVEAKRAAKDYPSNGEISFILGRTYLLRAPPDFEAADEAFKEASLKKYDRPNLLEYWSLTRLKRGDIAGLIKITGKFLAPNLSGISLLYRLAGLYRLARTREDQGDHSAALKEYQRVFEESSLALRDNLTEPVTANVTRLANAVPDYIIEAAYKAYHRDRFERIFELAVNSSADGYPPMAHLSRVVADIFAHSKSLSGDGVSKKRILSRNSDGLFTIGRTLVRLQGGDHKLTQQTLRAARELEKQANTITSIRSHRL